MPVFPVLHYLPEFNQTHVHWVSDASVFSFSSCPQSFPASGSFPMSWLFASGDQNMGTSAWASVLAMNIRSWFPLGWTGLISLLSRGLSRVFFNTTTQKHWANMVDKVRLGWEKGGTGKPMRGLLSDDDFLYLHRSLGYTGGSHQQYTWELYISADENLTSKEKNRTINKCWTLIK